MSGEISLVDLFFCKTLNFLSYGVEIDRILNKCGPYWEIKFAKFAKTEDRVKAGPAFKVRVSIFDTLVGSDVDLHTHVNQW
jgi:hypothetical protein